LVYRTLFYVNIYGSHKLLKIVRFFGPPCTTRPTPCITTTNLYKLFKLWLAPSQAELHITQTSYMLKWC